MTIEYRIDHATLIKLGNDVNIGVLAVAELIRAGAQVVGPIWPKPTSGTLTMYTDDMFGDLVFEWREWRE